MVAKAAKENEEVLEPVEEVEEIVVEPEAVAPPAPGVKRQLGVKEPIIFKWKILGASEGVILTLFKSVEREEADAQIERLGKEGYYKDLRIVDANEKVVQPKPPPPPKPAGAKPPVAPKPTKAAVKAAAKSAAAKAAATAKQNEPIRVPGVKKSDLPAKKGAKDAKGKDTGKKKTKPVSKTDSKAEAKPPAKKAKKAAPVPAVKKKKR